MTKKSTKINRGKPVPSPAVAHSNESDVPEGLGTLEDLEVPQPSAESSASESVKPSAPTSHNQQHERFARAAGEDDDGYDPWSDRPIKDPLYERDPWD